MARPRPSLLKTIRHHMGGLFARVYLAYFTNNLPVIRGLQPHRWSDFHGGAEEPQSTISKQGTAYQDNMLTGPKKGTENRPCWGGDPIS